MEATVVIAVLLVVYVLALCGVMWLLRGWWEE